MFRVSERVDSFLLSIIRAVAAKRNYPFTVVEFVDGYDHVRILRDMGTEAVIPVASILPTEEEVIASGY